MLWALGFMLFGVAASCEAVALLQYGLGARPLFRAYYLAGGVLTMWPTWAPAPAWLLLPKRGRDLLLGGLARGHWRPQRRRSSSLT